MNSNRDTDRYINRYYEDKGIGDRIKLEEKEGRRGDRRRWEEEEEGVTTESLFRAGTFTPKFDLGKGFVDFVRARGGGGEGRGFMLDMDYRDLVPDLRFSLNPSLNLIERRRDGKRGGFLEVGDRDDNLIELGEGDEGWRGWRGRGEDMVKQHRNRNDRLSKLICTVHDNKMAASSHWRLGQARGGRKRTGWHPAVPLRLIYDKEEWEIERMPSYTKEAFNEKIFRVMNEIIEIHGNELPLSSWKVLLQQSGMSGDHEGCEKIMRMMSGVDIKPDQECFFHFVNACSYNNPLKGLKIVNVLMNTSSMSLNLYNLMLQLLFTTGMPFEQSLAVLERIKNDGFEPNAVTYSLVIRSLTEAKEMEKSWDVFTEMHRTLYLDMVHTDMRGMAFEAKALNAEKTENQQDVFTHLLQVLKKTKPDIPRTRRGRKTVPYEGISGVKTMGLIFTAKEIGADWEDEKMLRRRTELAKKIHAKFEILGYDFVALGRIHFTGFACVMQLLIKEGMLEEALSIFVEGIGQNRKTMDFNHKNACAVHAMDAAVKRRNPGEALKICRILDEHIIHRDDKEKKRSIKEIRRRWEEEGEEKGEKKSYGFVNDGGCYEGREKNEKEIVNPRFLFNAFTLAMECKDRRVALELCDSMDKNLRMKNERKLRQKMRERAEMLEVQEEKEGLFIIETRRKEERGGFL